MASSCAAGSYANMTCNNCKGLDDADKGVLSYLWLGLTAAATTYNTVQAVDFALKQYKIAKSYANISKWWLNYHKTYFRPVEDQEIAEALALKEETPYYDVAMGRAQVAGRIKFKGLAEKNAQCTSEYCTGLRGVILRDYVQQEAVTVTALAGLGYRNERAYVESRSDVRWKRLIATASRGRDMQAKAINGAQLAFGIYGSLGSQAGASAAGAASMFGYEWNRRDTIYPTLGIIPPTAPPAPAAQADPTQPQHTSGYAPANANGISVAIP